MDRDQDALEPNSLDRRRLLRPSTSSGRRLSTDDLRPTDVSTNVTWLLDDMLGRDGVTCPVSPHQPAEVARLWEMSHLRPTRLR
jgi:hypothetical protein